MKKTLAITLLTGLAFGPAAFAQQPDGAAAARDRGAKLLQRLDQDADGKISRQELQAHALERFDAADADKNGSVSREEISQLRSAKKAERQAKHAARMQAADKNADARWSMDELSKMPQRVFAKLDRDGDGMLTEQELQAHHERKAKRRGERAEHRRSAGEKAGRGERGERRGSAEKAERGERRGSAGEKAERGPRLFGRADANDDGVVERAEVIQAIDARFAKLDKNSDGSVELSELKAGHGKRGFGKRHGRHGHRGAVEKQANDKT